MVKKVFAVIIGIALAASLSSCKKDEACWYQPYWDLYYITSEYDTYVAFYSAMNAVMEKYDGRAYISESSLKSDLKKVIDRYNNGALEGTVYLQKSTTSEDGPWTIIKSWTMKYSSKYTRSENIETSRAADSIRKK